MLSYVYVIALWPISSAEFPIWRTKQKINNSSSANIILIPNILSIGKSAKVLHVDTGYYSRIISEMLYRPIKCDITAFLVQSDRKKLWPLIVKRTSVLLYE